MHQQSFSRAAYSQIQGGMINDMPMKRGRGRPPKMIQGMENYQQQAMMQQYQIPANMLPSQNQTQQQYMQSQMNLAIK